MTDDDVSRIESEAESLLEEAVEFARRSEEPDLEEFLEETQAY